MFNIFKTIFGMRRWSKGTAITPTPTVTAISKGIRRPDPNLSNEDFKIWVSRNWPKQISRQFAIEQGTFTDHSPSSAYVAWSGVVVEYDGGKYRINAGNTLNKWIYWEIATPTVFIDTPTFPTLSADGVIVGVNVSGVFYNRWKVGQSIQVDMLVGTLIADEVKAGAIDGMTITGAIFRTAASGARVEINSTDGIKGIDASANILTQLTTAGLLSLATAASGARITLDATNGIKGIDESAVVQTQIKPDGYVYFKAIKAAEASGEITFKDYDGSDGMSIKASTRELRVPSGATDMSLSTADASAVIKFNPGNTVLSVTIDGEGINLASGNIYKINGTQIVGAQQTAIADATDAATTMARLNDLLAACRTHGLIDT